MPGARPDRESTLGALATGPIPAEVDCPACTGSGIEPHERSSARPRDAPLRCLRCGGRATLPPSLTVVVHPPSGVPVRLVVPAEEVVVIGAADAGHSSWRLAMRDVVWQAVAAATGIDERRARFGGPTDVLEDGWWPAGLTLPPTGGTSVEALIGPALAALARSASEPMILSWSDLHDFDGPGRQPDGVAPLDHLRERAAPHEIDEHGRLVATHRWLHLRRDDEDLRDELAALAHRVGRAVTIGQDMIEPGQLGVSVWLEGRPGTDAAVEDSRLQLALGYGLNETLHSAVLALRHLIDGDGAA